VLLFQGKGGKREFFEEERGKKEGKGEVFKEKEEREIDKKTKINDRANFFIWIHKKR
jgi:DNA-binding transcriptional regulator GbsR (MarR family)